METKKEMKFFTVVDFDREEDYLRRMHQSGWKLSKVKFKKATTSKLITMVANLLLARSKLHSLLQSLAP